MFRLQILLLLSLMIHQGSLLLAQSVDQNDLGAAIARGQRTYGDHCLACHMQDGSGMRELNPPLTNSKTVKGNKSRLIRIILEGMNESIEIDGVVYQSPMPGLKYLSDQQVADVLTYVRNSFENEAGLVTREEVAVLRKRLK